MRDSDFLRRQAESCIAMSRATIDLTLAGRLRAMAAEFRSKADEWEHEESDQVSHPGGGEVHDGSCHNSKTRWD